MAAQSPQPSAQQKQTRKPPCSGIFLNFLQNVNVCATKINICYWNTERYCSKPITRRPLLSLPIHRKIHRTSDSKGCQHSESREPSSQEEWVKKSLTATLSLSWRQLKINISTIKVLALLCIAAAISTNLLDKVQMWIVASMTFQVSSYPRPYTSERFWWLRLPCRQHLVWQLSASRRTVGWRRDMTQEVPDRLQRAAWTRSDNSREFDESHDTRV